MTIESQKGMLERRKTSKTTKKKISRHTITDCTRK